MRTNRPRAPIFTHEGGRANRVSTQPLEQLRRSVLANLLWEGTFYEDGESVADRIRTVIPHVEPGRCAQIAVEARNEQHLRHVPLLIAVEMAKLETHRHVVADVVEAIVQRPDEMGELLALYSSDREGTKKLGKLSKQIQKGLARAFPTFSEYQLAKYNRDAEVKLRDVLFLSHAKPATPEQGAVWKRLIDGNLEAPDTWEVNLSGGADKRLTWERLLGEEKLGGLALLRNLRNMDAAGVSKALIAECIAKHTFKRVLPFRFIAAERHAPWASSSLEAAFLRVCAEQPRLRGRTVVVVDNSYSMYGVPVSKRSETDRSDAACALAMIAREVCDDVRVLAFSGETVEVPARRGFGLKDAIRGATGHSSTYMARAIHAANQIGYDRIIVITDEQSHDGVCDPLAGSMAYMLNVATYENGVGYGAWTHINGWSDSVLRYITEAEPAA